MAKTDVGDATLAVDDGDEVATACGGRAAAAATALSREFCDDGLADPDDNTSFG